MQPQMTQDQAVMQIKARRANLTQVLVFKEAELAAHTAMRDALVGDSGADLSQVFPAQVVNAYKALVECKLAASSFEVGAIKAEIKQADQLLAQAASPILVPSRGNVPGGGGVKMF